MTSICCGSYDEPHDHHGHGAAAKAPDLNTPDTTTTADATNNECCSGKKSTCHNNKEEKDSRVTTINEHHHKHSHHDTTGVKDSCCGGHKKHSEADHPIPSTNTNSNPLCLAVIRESGADIVIFDASGRPRAFRYQGDVRHLCFSSHGQDHVDDLLTPCFDGDGLHGDPEESCFCGVDTPHLHAHLKDPKTCGTMETSTLNSGDRDISNLATHILLPVTDEDEATLEGFSDDDASMLKINVSEWMPNQCNAQEVQAQVNAQGGGAAGGTDSSSHRRRINKVKHEDHFDYLVHNTQTGKLHLEHPCHSCGMNDVHGTFKNVGQRRLARSGSSDIQMHFFEVSQRPFSILDHIQDFFQTHQSDRVAAVENLMENTVLASPARRHVTFAGGKAPALRAPVKTTEAVRSTFACTGICCSSEIPAILRALEPIKGVHKVMVNVSVKQVLVDFDPHLVSTAELATVLTKNGFIATIKYDGAAALAAAAVLSTERGRTVLYVEGICCASEVPAVKSILEPMKGVDTVTVNTTAKLVYVHHNIASVSSQQLADALSNEGFGASVRENAAKSVLSSQSPFVRSLLSYDDTNPNTDELSAFLRTFDSSQMESFVVDVPAKTITVLHNPFLLTAQTIADKLLEETGRQATVTTDGADPKTWSIPEWDDSAENLDQDERHTYPRPTVVLSGVCWVISMLHYVGGNWEYLKYVGLLSVVFGLPTIALKAIRTLRRFQFDANCLMLFASIGALALQEYSEAAALVFLFSISEWLEVRATSRARRALSAIVQLRPDKANIVHPSTQELTVVPASCVPVGALVSVKPGEKIPCDGVVVDGTSTLDESSLTGESRPVRKGPSDEVSGGTVNSGLTPLTVRTTATADNSAVAKLIRLVEEAQANKSATEKLIDEFAKYYTPIIVLAGIFMVSVPWAFGKEVGTLWTNNGLVLIVVACPCALIISTPVSYVAGLAATAQKGVLVKGGAHLEALGLVKQICFDKTGTLTNGEFALLHLQPTTNQLARTELFEYLTLMEEQASHPVASAILKAAQNEKVSKPKDKNLSKHAIVEGEGISGVIDNLEVHVGNERMFARLGLLTSLSESDRKLVDSWKGIGGTVGFMSVEGMGIVCAFCAADGIRPESVEVVGKLKKQGIRTVMLTGDNRDAALAIGRQAGLVEGDVLYGLLPEEKLRHVEDFSGAATRLSIICNPCSKRHLTMMVGDGVNDAPALAVADVGVAMGAGAALAMETADVTLLDSNLEKLLFAMNMGRRVLSKIKQNIVFSLTTKFIVLGFALAGKTNLWAAIGTDVGSMILVTLNSMMLLPARQRSADVQALKTDIEKGNSSHVPASSSACKKGCCDGPVAVSSKACSKGCCGSNPTPKPVVKASKPVSKSCSKGCCSSKSVLKPDGGAKSPPVSSKSCSKGCCSSGSTTKTDTIATKATPTSSKSCSKGCCSSSSTPTTNTNATKATPTSSKSCSKGCCSSNSTTLTIPSQKPEAGSKNSCGHNHSHSHGGRHSHGHSVSEAHGHGSQGEKLAGKVDSSSTHSHSHSHQHGSSCCKH